MDCECLTGWSVNKTFVSVTILMFTTVSADVHTNIVMGVFDKKIRNRDANYDENLNRI